MSTKNTNPKRMDYGNINQATQVLTINPEILAGMLQEYKGKPTNLKTRWMLFHDYIIGDIRQLVQNFERIEWEKTTNKIAEDKFNGIMLRIKNAQSKGRKSITVEFPFYEVNLEIGQRFRSKKITEKSLSKALHEFPGYGFPGIYSALSDLTSFLHGMYPKDGWKIGTWSKVVKKLLLAGFTITLNMKKLRRNKFNEYWKGILVITW